MLGSLRCSIGGDVLHLVAVNLGVHFDPSLFDALADLPPAIVRRSLVSRSTHRLIAVCAH